MAEAPSQEVNAGPRAAGGDWLTSREMLLLLVLAAVQFTHMVDFIIIMPLGPIFHKEMGLATWQFGIVVSAYTVSAGIAGLCAAQFLDRFDRKTALLWLYGGFTVSTLLCAVSPDFPLLVAARTVAGAFGGVAASVVLAIVGDAFHDARRGLAMGVVMSAFSIATIAGVPLGMYLAEQNGWRSTFFVLGGLSACVLMLAAVSLPSLRGHLTPDQVRIGNLWAVLTDPNHLRAYALTCALVVSSFLMGPYLATYLEGKVGVAQTNLKYVYLCGGLATLVTMTVFGRLADRFGKLLIFRILILLSMAPILFLTNMPAGMDLAVVLSATTVFMVLMSGRMVPAMALITASSAPAYRGSFMSCNSAVQQLAAGLATSLGGLLLQESDAGELSGFGFVGLLCCCATAACVVLAGRLRKDPSGDLAPDSLPAPSATHAIGD